VSAVLDLSGVSKNYHALRPLRIDRLSLVPGDHVAVLGFDAPSAEVLINVITGAVLPDQGDVHIFGQPTSSISSSDDWLALVDRFGIVSERAVLLDPMSVVQNLAMPFSLEIEPPSPELRSRAVTLAREVGLDEADWDRCLGDLDPIGRLRVRLGRALALDPAIVVLEHPSAPIDRSRVAALARDVRAVLDRRHGPGGSALASLTLTADPEFADAVATRVFVLDPASGRLTGRKRGWFGRGIRSL
jgi:ABC-type transporter Mla maintaining outer membrane lipid asymmetry ATPase subunit MlaF